MLVFIEKLNTIFLNSRHYTPAKKLRFIYNSIPNIVRLNLIVIEVYIIKVNIKV